MLFEKEIDNKTGDILDYYFNLVSTLNKRYDY